MEIALMCRRSVPWLGTLLALLVTTRVASGGGPSSQGPVPKADAALVLSGDVDYLRLHRAIELLRSGDVPILVLTGSGIGGDSAREMARIAEAEGVPEDALLLEERSTSTVENFEFAAPLIRSRGLRRIALVTSASHMERAQGVAARVLPEVVWVPVEVPDAGPPDRVRRARRQEWLKRAWYSLLGWP